MRETTDALSVPSPEAAGAAQHVDETRPADEAPEAIGGHVWQIRMAAKLLRELAVEEWHTATADWLDAAAERETEYLAELPVDIRCEPRPGDEAHGALTVARAYLGTVFDG